MTKTKSLTKQVLSTYQKLNKLNFNRGATGNCSVRLQRDEVIITPSGIAADKITESKLVCIDTEGKLITGGKPSTEWRLHCDIYKARADINAVIHVHSTFASALSCLNLDLPAFHYMVAIAGGDIIKCAPYALFGTPELSKNAIKSISNRKACLLAKHGLLTIGNNLSEAFKITVEIEELCKQYLLALMAGNPKILTKKNAGGN